MFQHFIKIQTCKTKCVKQLEGVSEANKLIPDIMERSSADLAPSQWINVFLVE